MKIKPSRLERRIIKCNAKSRRNKVGRTVSMVINMDNADLQKLRATPGKLTPRFSPSVTEYSITVASSVAEVKLTVLTSESGASYCIKVTRGLMIKHLASLLSGGF